MKLMTFRTSLIGTFILTLLIAWSGHRPSLADEPQKPSPSKPSTSEIVLFDFESTAESEAWSVATLAGNPEQEPEVKVAKSTRHATSGSACLQLTFDGGFWPAVMTKGIPVKG